MSVPDGVERDFPLARLTTVRTGGPADWFARPESEERLLELLAWAAAEGLAIGIVGSGSNLLVADEGFRGLAIKLDGALAAIEREGDRLLCGGGARLPSAAAKAAGWGLAGLEFGINIPGTAGGAVKMNANAYGGRLADVLEWVDVCDASGTERRAPDRLGFAYRSSNLGPGEVVVRASFALAAADPEVVKATLAGMRERRREAQPSGIKTFGSTFKNPEDERAEGRTAGQLLEAAGCRGLRVGGARFSEKHANFVENEDEASTADVLELMAEGGGGSTSGSASCSSRRCRRSASCAGRGGGSFEALADRRRGRGPRPRRGLRALPPRLERRAAADRGIARRGDRRRGRGGRGRRRRGVILTGVAPDPESLPTLRLDQPPKGGRLAGPALQQALVLGAAPALIRPCIASSFYGESGVDVELSSGIELRFGDASRAREKWSSAIAVLADESITALDYVDLHAPRRPAIGGEGHSLPSAEEGSGSSCGG